MTPGQHLRQLRHRLGWTQAQTAQFYGVTVQTVNGWENEYRNMPAYAMNGLRALEQAVVQYERDLMSSHGQITPNPGGEAPKGAGAAVALLSLGLGGFLLWALANSDGDEDE